MGKTKKSQTENVQKLDHNPQSLTTTWMKNMIMTTLTTTSTTEKGRTTMISVGEVEEMKVAVSALGPFVNRRYSTRLPRV